MTVALGFRIVRTPYPAASKLTGHVVQKLRDDGRAGAVVGDEALLWDALQEAQAEAAALRASLDAECAARRRLEDECEQLRRQVQGHAARIAAQSDLLGEQAERPHPEPKGKGKR